MEHTLNEKKILSCINFPFIVALKTFFKVGDDADFELSESPCSVPFLPSNFFSLLRTIQTSTWLLNSSMVVNYSLSSEKKGSLGEFAIHHFSSLCVGGGKTSTFLK